MIGPNYFVYISGQTFRDDARVRAFSEAMKLSLYDAKIMLGAPGPRKVAAFVKEEDAEAQTLDLRQAGFVAFVINKERFSRAPVVFTALKAVEEEWGLNFTIDQRPDLPQPKDFVKAVVVGYYTQTTTHRSSSGRRFRVDSSSRSEVQDPFIHLYSEDPHTILEICGPKLEFAWLKELGDVLGEGRWMKLAERFAAYYGAKLDATLLRSPAEADAITSALNVSSAHAGAGTGARTSAASSDDSPVAMAASRIIVYSLVFGV